jgi:hypothetical protein
MPRIFDNIELELLPVLRKTIKCSDKVDVSRETLEILVDKKLAKELLKRRKDAFAEVELFFCEIGPRHDLSKFRILYPSSTKSTAPFPAQRLDRRGAGLHHQLRHQLPAWVGRG